MESCSPWTTTQNTRTYISRVEQNLHTLAGAVDSCRGDLRLLNDNLLTSDNYSRFYFEKSVYYYHLHLNLLQERDETAREIERLQKNAAVAQGDILQLNELNEILQKRVVELERLEDDRIVEVRNLKAKIFYLEAEMPRNRWPGPIRVNLPCEDWTRPSLSPESSLDLNAEGSEVVNIVLDREVETRKSIQDYGRTCPTAHQTDADTGEISHK